LKLNRRHVLPLRLRDSKFFYKLACLSFPTDFDFGQWFPVDARVDERGNLVFDHKFCCFRRKELLFEFVPAFLSQCGAVTDSSNLQGEAVAKRAVGTAECSLSSQ